MIMITLLSICSVFFVLISITSAQSGPCRTPDNRNGTCTVLQQCGPLFRLVRKAATTEQRTFLQSSQCGRDGDTVFVCCSNTFRINYTHNDDISNGLADIRCKTPDNWTGNCIALQQCRPLYRLVRKAVTTEQRIFMQKSQCGQDGDDILVCCPNTFTVHDLPSTEHCGKQVGNKLVGDGETSIYELPWMALLHHTNHGAGGVRREGFFCGGSLINDNFVITAAHCVRGPKIISIGYVVDFVRLGENDLRSDPDCSQQRRCADPVEDVPVAEAIAHESYRPMSSSQEHDIALIRLERIVPYTDFIRPICLPVGKLQNRNYDGQLMVAAGFGKTDEAARSAVKLKVGLNGFNFNQCADIYRGTKINLTNGVHICAGGEEGKDSCSSDSGGPLLAEEMGNESSSQDPFSYLVGIISFGPRQCGTPGFPGVYTQVDHYIEWILDSMKK